MPKKGIVTPKFLTVDMARDAVTATLEAVYYGRLRDILTPHREQLHIVVLVPGRSRQLKGDYPHWSDCVIQPVVLYELSQGHPDEFEYPFDKIARSKALQLWTGRNDDRADCIPHLLFPGDTPYWGGVKRRGIVVSCSGLKPWIDKLISGMVADMLVAMAHLAWMESTDRIGEASFLK